MSAKWTICSLDGLCSSAFIACAAKQKHHQSESQHDQPPNEIDIHADRTLVDNAASRKKAEEGHDSANDHEQHSQGNSALKTPIVFLFNSRKIRFKPTSSTTRPRVITIGRPY